MEEQLLGFPLWAVLAAEVGVCLVFSLLNAGRDSDADVMSELADERDERARANQAERK